MNHNNAALKVALAAAEQLPRPLQRQLIERLVAASTPDESTVVLYLQQLSPRKAARLGELMDKNNNGRLRRAEKSELKQLGLEVDRMLLANSYALARAIRPELFDARGRPVKPRFRQATAKPSSARARPKRRNGRQ
jgi:hypothetical protein